MSELQMQKLSVVELSDHLCQIGVSEDAIKEFSTNKISGKALLLVDDSELRELLPTIGDRAIIRNLLKEITKVLTC